jgi:hypothetical protein
LLVEIGEPLLLHLHATEQQLRAQLTAGCRREIGSKSTHLVD